ncbi:diguanylate cyclase [Duganella sp. FT3S]|uniref:diguanylate cyclase n=1 Tax=Rugamonas fusca TaxID=2758568 RepID=A0A7W2EL35_9BURK|nr:GGDEF domain-containing protein [Rugamonas fusca]MBA5607912.1 diguanylate cyclase [Rugamonas fusca]
MAFSDSGARRLLLATALLAPVLACAQTPLDQRIAEVREQSRFVPDQALAQLLKLQTEADGAPAATRAEIMSQISLAHMRLGENEAALAQADAVIAYGKAQRNDAILANGLLSKAYVKFAQADVRQAHQLAFEAEATAARTNDLPLRVQAIITAGQAHAERGDFPTALVKLQAAVDLARQITDQLPLATALNALTQLYNQMREYDKGFAVLEELLRVTRALHSAGRMAVAKDTEYGLAIEAHQPARALRALQEALALERQLGAQRMIANSLVNLSDNYLKERDYARALRYGNESLQAAREAGSAPIEATARVNIGEAYLGMGRIADGKKSFEAGLAFYEKANSKPDLQSVLLEYGQALERAGDLRGAVDAYHRERAISNELFEKQRQQAVLELQEKYEADKRQRQIELLSRENQVKGAELDNRRLQQRVWWLLALVFALAAMVVGLLYRKVRHANAQLEVKNLELKAQSALDPLTSLYNRRHFQDYMRGHAPAERREPPARTSGGDDIVGALFLLDVDHFKHVNDSYGHAAGDAVLKMIAEHLRIALRETDMIVRWGGEEFLAFLPAIPRHGVDEVARRILESISAQTVAYQDHHIQVNVSVGFAPFPLFPDERPLSWERAVNLVDMALYLAKAHGRNRAYGVRGFANFADTSMEAIEQDLERAWRAGYVDLSVVLGPAVDGPPPAGTEPSNVVPLKQAAKHGY